MKKENFVTSLDKNIKQVFSRNYSHKQNNPVNKTIKTNNYKQNVLEAKGNKNSDNKIEKDGISIIAIVSSDETIDMVFSYYKKQDFSRKEMIIALNNDACDVEKWLYNSRKNSMVRVYLLDNLAYDQCKEYCIERSIYEIHILFDKDSRL